MRRVSFVCLVVLSLVAIPLQAAHTAAPSSVTVAGSLQSELGCPGDWQPDCSNTFLLYDASDDVWQKTFTVPAGSWEYKVALNASWDENYGLHAQANGANTPLNLAAEEAVKFYYDHETHWVTSNRNATIAVAAGSFQSELGCGGDWQPDCLRSWLQDPDGDGIYTFTAVLPAGSYETKVAIAESWSENYGAGGTQDGANIPFTVAGSCAPTLFSWNSTTKILTVTPGAPPPQPASVTMAGSLQSELGCPGDWQPACAATHLAFDAGDGVWQGTFNVPAGSWEYKAAINDSWDENYGANATANGPNIGLPVGSATAVKFYYDHSTHWIADNRTKVIATAPGSFQSELGCPGDWQPDCLQSWLQDPDGDGTYTFSTTSIPAGSYETKVAINESWSENYGAGGVANGANIAFTVPTSCAEVLFSYDAATHVLTVTVGGAPKGDLARAKAYWLAEDLIAWNAADLAGDSVVRLHASATASLALGTTGVTGGTDIVLTRDAGGVPAAVAAKFPHLASLPAFRIPAASLSQVPAILKGQFAVSAKSAGDALIDATSLQIPGVLDDLYTYDGALGVTWSAGVPTVRVWAPTAKSVALRLFADSATSTFVTNPMTEDPATGVWSVTGDATWTGKFYLFAVEVYAPTTRAIETNLVTDPYSLSLSTNSARSQVVDLSSAALKPAGWDAITKPVLEAPEDIAIYELHVRDFSASDASVPAADRGTFKAFSHPASNGMQHLAALASAGLTHVHLLPAFDFATVDEDKSTWESPAGDLSSFAPDSESQQAAVNAVRDTDAFNWGYDPFHYTVPEGSYATNPDGSARILEFRQMVAGLGAAGLRTVMDVVYNHTTASGQNSRSVLDRIVPGYYHRLNSEGGVERSSCCENTASEHNMMEKLMIDSVVTWAKQYKVDGFRFDLMGHHMKSNMIKLRQRLDALTVATDGVDGSKIYLYGEAWNFGEVANNARGVNAIQPNMAGTGIGSFNDRIRDGVRGGGPFSGLQEQGFATGLYYDPNATNQGTAADQLARVRTLADWIRTGVAGGLRNYAFVAADGNLKAANQVDYNGQQAGYTDDPQEIINYVEAHDNETLFDSMNLKLPLATTMAQRVRAHNLALDLVTLAQGIPFFHAGADIVRSKSLDRNSYNSGDWFNRIDFTYQSNNWGVGAPPAGDNQANWPVMKPLLASAALKPAPADINTAKLHLREMLAIRKSSPLFRLRTAADVGAHLQMLNTGASQIPGLIVTKLVDPAGAKDHTYSAIVTLFNANDETATFTDPDLASAAAVVLHPVQAGSADPGVKTATFSAGTFTVPARTTAVFVNVRPLQVWNGIMEQYATAGLPFTFTFDGTTFTDAANVPRLTFTAVAAPGWTWPAWLSFNGATRTFSGTPQVSDVGTTWIRITATDGFTSAYVDWKIEVINPADAPVITLATPLAFCAGGSGATAFVHGTGFTAQAQLSVNNVVRPVTFLTPGLMSFTVTDADVAVAGDLQVRVITALGTSNAWPVHVVTSAAPPFVAPAAPATFYATTCEGGQPGLTYATSTQLEDWLDFSTWGSGCNTITSATFTVNGNPWTGANFVPLGVNTFTFIVGDSAGKTTTAQSQITVRRLGDLDGDGDMDQADRMALANYLADNAPPPPYVTAGDVNDDGTVDLIDLVELEQALGGTRPGCFVKR